jgi:Rrf2 family protein
MLLNNRDCQTTRSTEKVLEKSIQDLMRYGLIKSKRGACGGYTLARSPEQISFYDVITAIEGPSQSSVPTTTEDAHETLLVPIRTFTSFFCGPDWL